MPVIKVDRGFIPDHIIRQKYVLTGLLLVGWLNSVISFLLPVSIGEFFTIFFHTSSSKGKLLNWLGIELSSVNQFFIFFLTLLAAKALLTFLENYGTFLQGEKLARSIREVVFTS
ncbi:MAG TPA: hypothetical protein VJ508_20760, partial [Saprospiraceae bacterium]|nr:hypothetical protein [Saprospiraceae bacterium]